MIPRPVAQAISHSTLLRVVHGRVPLRLGVRHGLACWRGDCPFCDPDGGGDAFFVHPDRYICAWCTAHGNALDFLMRFEGIDRKAASGWLVSYAPPPIAVP